MMSYTAGLGDFSKMWNFPKIPMGQNVPKILHLWSYPENSRSLPVFRDKWRCYEYFISLVGWGHPSTLQISRCHVLTIYSGPEFSSIPAEDRLDEGGSLFDRVIVRWIRGEVIQSHTTRRISSVWKYKRGMELTVLHKVAQLHRGGEWNNYP